MRYSQEDLFEIRDGKKYWRRGRVNGYSSEDLKDGEPKDNHRAIEGCDEVLTRDEINSLFPNQLLVIKILEFDTFPRYWTKAQVLYFHCSGDFCLRVKDEMNCSDEYATYDTYAKWIVTTEKAERELAESKEIEAEIRARSTDDIFIEKDGKRCWDRSRVYGYSDEVMQQGIPEDNEDIRLGCDEPLTQKEIAELFPNQRVFLRVTEYVCNPTQWRKAAVLYFHCSGDFAERKLRDLNYSDICLEYRTYTFNASVHYLNW